MIIELKESYVAIPPGCPTVLWRERAVTPTGRWKVINVNGESELLIEVKKRLFGARWISSRLLEVERRDEYINECGGSHEED